VLFNLIEVTLTDTCLNGGCRIHHLHGRQHLLSALSSYEA
jgi:hypothetical protein